MSVSPSSSRRPALLRHFLIAGVSAPALLAAAPATAQTVVNSGQTLELQGDVSRNDTVTISGDGTAGGGAIRNVSGYNTLNGNVTLAANATIRSEATSTLLVTSSLIGGGYGLTTTGDGQILIQGSVTNLSSLRVNGGKLSLYGATTINGPVTVSAGELNLLSGNESIGDLAAVTVETGAIMTMGAPETIGSLSGGGTVRAFGGKLALTVGGNNSSTNFSGSLQNGGPGGVDVTSLTKIGTGTLTLAGANSYTGGTTIRGGTLQVGNGGTTGALGTGNIALDGGTLVFNRSNDITVADKIAGIGQIIKLGAGTLTLSGDNLDSQSTGDGPYFGSFSIQAGTLAVGRFGFGAADLVEIYNGAALSTIAHSRLYGDVTIHAGGGTIDTGAFNFDMSGAVDFQGALTKAGSGTLLIEDRFETGTGAGGINVTGGTVALGSNFAAGTGIIKLASGTTLRNATCNCTPLSIDNEVRIAPGGTANFDGASFDTNLNGVISGGNAHFVSSVSVEYVWASFFLNAANTYGDSLIGPNVELVVMKGNLGTGDVRFDSARSAATTPAALIFRNATDYSFGGKIVGAGIVSGEADPASTITLTGSNTSTDNFTGKMEVFSGKLLINGDFGDVVNNSAILRMLWGDNGGGTTASLGGTGTFHGSVSLDNAELNPGNSPGTLTIAGSLVLGAGSILNYELGEPGTPGGVSNDLVNVGGNLTLDGTLNTIASGPAYGPGYYRLFNYGGTLTDNGLSIGSIAGGLAAEVRTNINGQVNVRLGGAQAIQYWDGADMGTTVGVTGGAGSWNSANTNWTSPTGYAINDSWRGQVGVFAGAASGTVTVGDTQAFEELRFETDGYLLRPFDRNARLTTTGGFSIIDVKPGITADIGVIIQGGAGLDKTGDGTLILSAVNTYSGATEIAGGTLRLGVDDAIAATSAVNVLAGGTFDLGAFDDTVGSLDLTGTLSGTGTLTAGTYTLRGTTLGANLGAGDLIQASGTSTLNGSVGTQNVTVGSGTLRLGAANRLVDNAVVRVRTGTTLDLQGFDDTIGALELDGTLSGTGTLSATSYELVGATIDANLSGGTLVQAGGSSILRGNATGVTARVEDGSLQIGDGGTSGSFTGNVATEGDLVFHRSDAVTYAGAISGNGYVIQRGGALTLTGDSSAFTGTAIVSGSGLVVAGQIGGDVRVNQGTLSGTGSIAGPVRIADGAHLAGSQGSTLSMGSLVLSAGAIVDVSLSQPSAAAIFDVAGNLTLDGRLNVTSAPNFGAGVYRLFSYGGSLTDNGLDLASPIAGASLQTAVAGQVNLINVAGATLSFWDGGNAAAHDNGAIDGGSGTWSTGGRNWTTQDGGLNGPMTPAPSFAVFQGTGGTVTIDGQVSATGMQFAANGYTVSGGPLSLSGARATIRVGDGTAAGASFTATIASALTGASTLVKTDLGTLVLTGANSYTGGTVIEAGTLIGNAGSIQGNVANAGALVFDQAVNATYAGSVTGAGTTTKSGAGTLTLTGANATKWQVTAGSLVSTTTSFTGNADLAQGTSLVFNQTTNGSYAGVLTGAGSVAFQGGGTVLLTGDSSAFAGTTSTGSLLSVNGKLGGMVDVLASGRLQGTGTIGSARIAGTIAPGNSIGTLTVTGNLSFLSGSIYEVEANVAGESDKITVGGSASIASGATVRVLAEGGKYGLNTNYTILTAAGGLTGTFSGVTSNLAFLTPSLSYSATAVTLSLKRNTVDFVSVAQTANQHAIAPAIEALGMGTTVYDAVAVLTEAEARAAFDQLAGSDYASMRGQLIEDSRFLRDAMLARTGLAGVEGLSAWGRAIGSWNSMDGNAEALGYDRSIKGFSTGFDGSLGANWRAGVALGYTNSELRTGNATHKADSYSTGGQVLGAYGPVRIQLGAAYSWHDVRAQRRLAFGGLAQALSDNYDARTFQLFGEVGAKADLGGLQLQPFVGVAHVTLFDGKITEHGGSAALSGGADSVKVTYGNVGLRSKLAFDLGKTKLRLTGSATLRRTFGDHVPTIDLGFAGGRQFQAQGVPLDRTSGLVDAGIEVDLGKRTTFGVSYTGAYGARTTDHGARASISLRF